ncbi:MAG: hypothetical protein DWQ20_00860 [Actinobacteria bacterium]|nr:MAG: hypothetical protein DWQ20_00860 [Actinomycetota bacterium]
MGEQNELAAVVNEIPRQTAIERAGPDGVLSLIQQAMNKDMPPESIERLFSLFERMADRQASQEFAAAMAAFKSECPPIPRRTQNSQFMVEYVDDSGVRHKRPRMYASLEDIESTIREILGRHGLSYRWEDTKVQDGALSMVCVIDHEGGHSKRSPVVLPVDSKAGCSDQQKYGAAMSYAQRYSLVQALGLITCDEDDDGNTGATKATVTEDQARELELLAENVGANVPVFLGMMNVESFEDIPAARYRYAVAMLEKKRQKNGGKA